MSEERERIEALKKEIKMLKQKLKNKKIQQQRSRNQDRVDRETSRETNYFQERAKELEEIRLENEKDLATPWFPSEEE